MDQSMGFLPPLSFVSHSDLPYVDNMTFQQRIYNTLITAYDAVFRRLNYIRGQDKLAKKHFGKFIQGELPKVLDMEREVSVVLVNSHKSVDKPRPKMPGLIEIGGAHVKAQQRIGDKTIAV
jgi:glucuronosyltransferase